MTSTNRRSQKEEVRSQKTKGVVPRDGTVARRKQGLSAGCWGKANHQQQVAVLRPSADCLLRTVFCPSLAPSPQHSGLASRICFSLVTCPA